MPIPKYASAYLLFFISGACGLVYQVIWTRQLVLLLGAATYAVSTVLAVFFLGLAAGSRWGGRLSDRTASPLRVYGYIEIGIGLWAAATPFILHAAAPLVADLLGAVQGGRILAIATRAIVAALILFLPVFLMGVTFPLLSRFVTHTEESRGNRLGLLYAINTTGAITGCLAAGFYLLPTFGYTRATLIAAAANGIAGIAALALSRGGVLAPPASRADAIKAGSPLILIAFAVSGFCALALEVVWTRLLTIVYYGTTYAFTTMLAAILTGIALGSLAASFLADRIRNPKAAFGIALMLAGAACLHALAGLGQLPSVLQEANLYHDFTALTWTKFRLSFATLFPATFLFGCTFPLAARAATGALDSLGADLGRLYAANTLGGVAGAIAGGFILLPFLGMLSSVYALATLFALTGATVIYGSTPKKSLAGPALIALGAAIYVVTLFGSPHDPTQPIESWYLAEDERVVYSREGIEGTVVVSEPANPEPVDSDSGEYGSRRQIWVNGVQATSTYERGVKMNRFQGALPLLLIENPKRALFMCFGSGVTLGTLALSDFERIDAVEISHAVIEASPYFHAENYRVLENHRVNLIIDDGRNFLARTRETYDLISFEPMPMFLSGVGNFYTDEYYRQCADHLNPGGIVMQWFPLHGLEPTLVNDLVGTFLDVFPHVNAWFINADLFLTGSLDPQTVYLDNDPLTTPLLDEALSIVGIRDAIDLLGCYWADKDALRKFVKGDRRLSDDLPWAEFEAPKNQFTRHTAPNLERLRTILEQPTDLLADSVEEQYRNALERRWNSQARFIDGLIEYNRNGAGEPHFIDALKTDPSNPDARYYLLRLSLGKAKRDIDWDRPQDAVTRLQAAIEVLPNEAPLHFTLAEAHLAQQQFQQANNAFYRGVNYGNPPDHLVEQLRNATTNH